MPYCRNCGKQIDDMDLFCGNCGTRQIIHMPSYTSTNSTAVGYDLFDKAVNLVLDCGAASVSILQKNMGIGYPQAARLIEELERKNIIGPFEGSKPRKILITKNEWINKKSVTGRVIDTSTRVPEPETPSDPKKYTAPLYKVGVGIPAGKYKLFSNANSECLAYYSICKDATGDDIVISDSFKKQAYIAVKNDQYLELCHCYAVPISQAAIFHGSIYDEGEYSVGQEINAGEYTLQAEPGEDAYYSLESLAPDGSRNIISNRTFSNITCVSPEQGQILVLKNCTLSL